MTELAGSPSGPTTVHVGGASPYDVVVGHDVLDRLPTLLGPDVRRVALCHAPGLGDLVARVRAQLAHLEVLDQWLGNTHHHLTRLSARVTDHDLVEAL